MKEIMKQFYTSPFLQAKLTSEVGVLVKDFEHSQVVIKELTAK